MTNYMNKEALLKLIEDGAEFPEDWELMVDDANRAMTVWNIPETGRLTEDQRRIRDAVVVNKLVRYITCKSGLEMGTQQAYLRDLLPLEIDIDVYNDVIDDTGIALCGPTKLTDKGEQEFKEALDLPVEILDPDTPYQRVMVMIDDPDEAVWKRRRRILRKFLWSAAGYVDEKLFNEWFEEEE